MMAAPAICCATPALLVPPRRTRAPSAGVLSPMPASTRRSYGRAARNRRRERAEAAARPRLGAVQEGPAPPVRQGRLYQAFPGWPDGLTGGFGRAEFRQC